MDQRVTIIGLGVSNLLESTAFYENILGWDKAEFSTDDISFFRLNGILLSLYPSDKLAEDAQVSSEGSGFNHFTLAHNTDSEKEVDAIISNLKNQGVTIIKEPQKVFWGGYSSYFADPDGHLWEVAYNPFLDMDETGKVK